MNIRNMYEWTLPLPPPPLPFVIPKVAGSNELEDSWRHLGIEVVISVAENGQFSAHATVYSL